jgi:hypothetical protein
MIDDPNRQGIPKKQGESAFFVVLLSKKAEIT